MKIPGVTGSHTQPCPAFYMGVKDLNSGPQAYRTSLLITFLLSSPQHYCLTKGLWLNLKLIHLVWLVGQRAPSHLSQYPQQWGYRHTLPCLHFCISYEDPILGPCAYGESTLSTEPPFPPVLMTASLKSKSYPLNACHRISSSLWC